MQKRVHFAPTNTVFSSRTPSPTLSDCSSRPSEGYSSSSDSSAVSTPPPEVEYDQQRLQQQQYQQHQQQQYHHYPHDAALHHYAAGGPLHQHPSYDVSPKSPPQQQHMNIHLFLAFHPEMDIPLRYDLSNGFITSHITNEDLFAAATEPPLSSLTIICPHLAWEIHVAPAPTSSPYSPDGGVFIVDQQQRDYVTVYDVLCCLYRSLRQVVTPEEYDNLAPPGPSRDAVGSAYHTRISRTDDITKRMRDEKFGVRRIDFLQGLNMFRGLAGTLVGPDVWELNVTSATMMAMGLATPGAVAPVMAIAASTTSVN